MLLSTGRKVCNQVQYASLKQRKTFVTNFAHPLNNEDELIENTSYKYFLAINKPIYYVGLARFAFMHCIGTSLCFWMKTIADETLHTLVEKITHSEDTCHPEDHHSIYEPNYYNNLSMIHGLIFDCLL